MYTALYLNNLKIVAAVGSFGKKGIRIKNLYETYAPEGSLVNGVVMDADALTECLRQFFKEKKIPGKNVILVLNSTRLNLKMIQAPKMSRKQTNAYIGREFAAMQQRQDMVIGYFKESENENGIRNLFATRMEREFLDVYEGIFRKIGARLTMVQSGLGALVEAVSHFDYLQGKTCIVQVMGESNIYSILFVKGHYVYSTSTRTFQEKGTPSYGLEVARTLSGMMQFASAQKLEEPISEVYWGSFDEENEKVCRQGVAQMNFPFTVTRMSGGGWIKVAGREESRTLGMGVFAVAAIGLSKMTTDLYRNYRKDSSLAKKQKAVFTALIPVFVTLGLGVILSGGAAVWNYRVSVRYKQVKAYNESEAVNKMKQKYEELSKRDQFLTQVVTELQKAKEDLESYPDFNSDINELLKTEARGLVGVEIKGYHADTGAVQLSVTSDQMDDINRYVKRLEDRKEFVKVDYTGYSQSQQDQMWYGNVIVYLTAPNVQEEG